MIPHLGSQRESKRGSAGFTLSELTIASVILVTVSAAIVGTLGSLRQLVSTGTVSSELQSLGGRALSSVMDDLRMSGFVNEGGASYPYLFDDGDANAASRSGESRRAYLDQSPVRGELNPIAPPLVVSIERREDGSQVARGRVRLGSAYEGPPGSLHGGFVAATWDGRDLSGPARSRGEALEAILDAEVA